LHSAIHRSRVDSTAPPARTDRAKDTAPQDSPALPPTRSCAPGDASPKSKSLADRVARPRSRVPTHDPLRRDCATSAVTSSLQARGAPPPRARLQTPSLTPPTAPHDGTPRHAGNAKPTRLGPSQAQQRAVESQATS